MAQSGIIKTFKYFTFSENVLLVIASVADRIFSLVPLYIYRNRNFYITAIAHKFSISTNIAQVTLSKENYPSFKLRKKSSDLLVFNQIWIEEEYAYTVNLIIQKNIQVKTILDAGSNIGLTALYLNMFFKEAEILCVEPDDDNFLQLQKNMEINNITSTTLIKGGVWSQNELLEMDYSYRDGLDWSRRLKKAENGEGAIKAYSIHNLMEEKGWTTIDFLKIDVEGAEEIIFGEGRNLQFLESVKVFTIEIHDKEKMGHQIIKLLLHKNFEIFMSGELLIGIKV